MDTQSDLDQALTHTHYAREGKAKMGGFRLLILFSLELDLCPCGELNQAKMNCYECQFTRWPSPLLYFLPLCRHFECRSMFF